MWKPRKLAVFATVVLVLGFLVVLTSRPSLLHDGLHPRDNGQVRGQQDAEKDLAGGHYIQIGYGLPLPWTSEFGQCLQGYGIEVRYIGGDTFVNGRDLATGYELSYYQSYNAVSSAAIKQHFGSDVFDRCTETARKKWESTHPQSKP